MSARGSLTWALLAGLLLAVGSFGGVVVSPPSANPRRLQAQVRTTRRVNVPYFDGDVRFAETAVFWFGRVTPAENSVDARVGYNDEHLYVHVAAFDRRVWYDTSPSAGDLTAWDAVTLHLDTDEGALDSLDTSAYRFDAQLVW